MASTYWAKSAGRHGIERADALNAMSNAVVHIADFDTARVGKGGAVDLFIGPTRDESAFLEVMAHSELLTRTIVIFHVMRVRPVTIRRAFQVTLERDIQ